MALNRKEAIDCLRGHSAEIDSRDFTFLNGFDDDEYLKTFVKILYEDLDISDLFDYVDNSRGYGIKFSKEKVKVHDITKIFYCFEVLTKDVYIENALIVNRSSTKLETLGSLHIKNLYIFSRDWADERLLYSTIDCKIKIDNIVAVCPIRLSIENLKVKSIRCPSLTIDRKMDIDNFIYTGTSAGIRCSSTANINNVIVPKGLVTVYAKDMGNLNVGTVLAPSLACGTNYEPYAHAKVDKADVKKFIGEDNVEVCLTEKLEELYVNSLERLTLILPSSLKTKDILVGGIFLSKVGATIDDLKNKIIWR